MPADVSMYNALGARPKSMADYDAENMDVQGKRQNLLMGQQKLDAYSQDQAEKTALRSALGGGIDLSTPEGQAALYRAAPTLAPGILKTHQEGITAQALAAKDTAQAGNFNAETDQKKYDLGRQKLDRAMQMVSQSPTPDVARQHVADLVSHGLMSMQEATQKMKEIPDDPAAYKQWRLSSIAQLMSAHDQFEANKPSIQTRNTGGTTDTLAVDPMTGVPTVTGSVRNTQSPDNVASVGATLAGQRLTDQRERDRLNIERVKADPYGTLGLNKNVTPAAAAGANKTGDEFLATLPPAVANQVKMLAEGRMPITAMSARSPQMMQLLSYASQYEPGTDATTYLQRAQTVKDFAPGGKDGQAITNANTALHHAGQVADAIEKLDNSNILPGITNPVENYLGQKLGGQSTQGVYKQKVDALASELRKLYAGGGGGSLSELNSWQSSFDGNASKEQQKAYLKSGMELLVGAIQAKQNAYERGMGSRAQFGTMLAPDGLAVLKRLAPEYAATLGGGAAPAQPKPAPAGGSSDGWTLLGVH